MSLLPGGNGWEQLPYKMDGVLVGNVEEKKTEVARSCFVSVA